MAMAWYVVHTYSGFEDKAKRALQERIRVLDLEERFGEILIPTESVVEVRNGQKRIVTRKFFPGYIMVQMELDNQTWHVVRNTPKITGFVGSSRNPPPIAEAEVNRITNRMSQEEEEGPRPVLHFENGERVRVIDGPFGNMEADVAEVNDARGKVRVIVTIFGRPTSVELDFTQVEKLP